VGTTYTLERELGGGDRARATTDHQYVAEAWRHGDPDVQPYVQESRAALQRLTGETGR
jgi:hypothetical protein